MIRDTAQFFTIGCCFIVYNYGWRTFVN